jgi:hypothetical protein
VQPEETAQPGRGEMSPDEAQPDIDQQRQFGHELYANPQQRWAGAFAVTEEADLGGYLGDGLPNHRSQHQGHSHQQGEAS